MLLCISFPHWKDGNYSVAHLNIISETIFSIFDIHDVFILSSFSASGSGVLKIEMEQNMISFLSTSKHIRVNVKISLSLCLKRDYDYFCYFIKLEQGRA